MYVHILISPMGPSWECQRFDVKVTISSLISEFLPCMAIESVYMLHDSLFSENKEVFRASDMYSLLGTNVKYCPPMRDRASPILKQNPI